MAQPPALRRLSAEDLGSIEPAVRKGLEKLMTTLNPFLGGVAGALEGRLTWDNFAAKAKVVELTASADLSVRVSCSDVPGKIQHVIVTRAEDITDSKNPIACVAPQIAWENVKDGILIVGSSGLTNGNKYRLRLLVTA